MNKVKQNETPLSLMDPIADEDSLLLNARYMAGGSRGIVVRTSLPQAGGFADVLSRLDFNEAISLAKTVNKKPLALMLQASICRRVIESSQKEAQKAQ